jgi:outer membrane lipase/esterase
VKLREFCAALALVLLLSACGGGGGSSPAPDTTVTSVKAVGASLADSGTFGYKFTVQTDVSSTTTYRVYTEDVAAAYAMSAFCSAYTWSSGLFSTNPGCTNYAVAGAQVNNYDSTYGLIETLPTSVIKQLVDAGNAGFGPHDLLIVGEASSNDAKTLALAYLDDLSSGSTTEFPDLVATMVSSTVTDPAVLGAMYMQALANKLFNSVKTNALDKGAIHVAIVNTLDISKTPLFQAELATLSDPDAASAIFDTWVRAYNDQLAALVAPYSDKVVVVDLYSGFNERVANPGSYGLTNVSGTVCDEIATGGTSPGDTTLATPAVVAQCTDANASSTTPSVGSFNNGDWWKTWLFADNFHPTPSGHQQLADIVTTRLTAAGW